MMLIIQCLAALLPSRKQSLGDRLNCAVLIPAHNEEQVIEHTLSKLLPQLQNDDRVLVVADNCDDATADIAKRMGASVFERTNLNERGKGYALAAGIDELSISPPEVVVIIDADCEVTEGALDILIRSVSGSGKPIQALYLMTVTLAESIPQMVSNFAFAFKNYVRAKGMNRLGCGVNLTGTGMAFSWNDITSLNLATGNIVEDMDMGLDLIQKGRGPILVAEALVKGALPISTDSSKSQRTRWEHGHLQTIMKRVPSLIKRAVIKRDLKLFLNSLDIAIPPLALFGLIIFSWLVVLLGVGFLTEDYRLFTVYLSVMLFMVFIALTTWWRFLRPFVPASVFLGIPSYILSKLFIYSKFLRKRETKWVKTKRD
jgi:cellulose synthase/poly-beta-1,6-N-acetylglucosamine synthase-like glycosyltransferase